MSKENDPENDLAETIPTLTEGCDLSGEAELVVFEEVHDGVAYLGFETIGASESCPVYLLPGSAFRLADRVSAWVDEQPNPFEEALETLRPHHPDPEQLLIDVLQSLHVPEVEAMARRFLVADPMPGGAHETVKSLETQLKAGSFEVVLTRLQGEMILQLLRDILGVRANEFSDSG